MGIGSFVLNGGFNLICKGKGELPCVKNIRQLM